MTFKELRAGMPVYFLSGKEEDIDIKQGKVVQGAGPSHAPTPQPGQSINYLGQPVVDVSIELDGIIKSYEVAETLDSTFGGGMMISPNLPVVLAEVSSRKAQAQERINRYEHDKSCVERCEMLEARWDERAKERKENDDRFRSIENNQKEMKCGFDEIKGMISSLLKKLE